MKFYDRDREIESLRKISDLSESSAQFTVITGRRRVGKTSLVWRAYQDITFLYFFVARKSESELCESFMSEIEEKLGVLMMGRATSFSQIFEYIMKLSMERRIVLFIDEFQDFLRVNKSIHSDMQRIWDMYHDKSHINLIVCGSIYSMMNKIFKDRKEPLYNRQTRFMNIRPFALSVLKNILSDHNPNYSNEDLLALFSFTGGVAKYVQLLIDSGCTTKSKMINHIIKADSVFISEGKSILIEEFGKDYGVYFTILSAIARGKTLRSEIEYIVGKEIGGYLTKLENDYGIISKKQPIFEGRQNKNVRYTIEDNFFTFWFRFVYKYNYMLEIDNYEGVKKIISRDYETFSGLMLERYCKKMLIEKQEFTRIGSWWDRKGENEIDIIAENEFDKNVVFYEVKRKIENIKLSHLNDKVAAFQKSTGKYLDYNIECKSFTLSDI